MSSQPRTPGALILIGVLCVACDLQAQPGYDLEVDSGSYSTLPWGMLASPLWEGDDPAMPSWGFDDRSTEIPIGFTFWYYGEPHTSLWVTTNGIATFSPTAASDWTNDSIPSTVDPDDLLAPWWDDLCVMDFGSIDRVLYEFDGFLPGSRRLSVEWRSITLRGGDATNHRYVNFQLHLFEADNSIEFHYGGTGTYGVPPDDFTATIGIENQDGTQGATPYWMRNDLTQGEFPASGTIFRFTPMPVPSYEWGYCSSSGSYDALPWTGTTTTVWNGGITAVDDSSFDISIGFPFVYYGTTQTTLRISSNGYATFPPASGTNWTNDPIPSTLIPNPVIAPWWDDLYVADFGVTDTVVYERDTTFVGFRRLSVQWSSVSRHTDTTTNYHWVNFQLHLLEFGDRVQFHFGPSGIAGTPAADFGASIGVEDYDGLVGCSPFAGTPSLTSADFPASGTRICFEPPPHWLICGDCNGDSVVSIIDSLLGAQHAVTILTLTGDDFAACNVEGVLGGSAAPGAAVTILDALVIAQYAAGIGDFMSCMP